MDSNDNNSTTDLTGEVVTNDYVNKSITEKDLENLKPGDETQFIDSLKNGRNNPEDLAAAFFKLEYPKFVAMLNCLSMNELIRLCINLAGNEFVPDKNKLKTEKEKKAYYIGNQMVHNRAIMQLSFEMEKAEEAYKREQENLKIEEQNLNKGENENGKEQTS